MRILFLTFLSLITFSIQAQELDLSYDEAVKIALEQNVTLRTQQNEMKIVKAEKAQSRGEMAPSASANLRGYQAINAFNDGDGSIINGNIVSGSFNTELNVFSGFSQVNQVKRASANFNAQLKQIERTSQDVIFEVTNQFLQVLLDTEFLKIAKDNLKTQELLYQQIDAMVEAGSRPKSDAYDQQAVVKNNELLVLKTANTLSNSKSNLAIILQLDPMVELTVIDPNWAVKEISLLEMNLDDLYDQSIANRPDLKQFEFNEFAAEKAISISKAYFAPSLYAFYNLGSQFNNISNDDIDHQITTTFRRSNIGLNLSIPIYSGLRNRTQYVRQKVYFENAKINTENLKKTILNDVRNAYQNFQDVRSAYEVSIAQLDAAELAQKVQQEKYNLGVGSLIELTNANNNHISAAAGNAQAKLNLLFQKVILDYYTGVLAVP